MKKYLSIALAVLCLAACAEKIDDDSSVQNGEVESSYIAINLSATEPSTRADGGTYQEGAAEERAVETAYFFFFDANGNAFHVNVDEGAANGPGGTNNYLQATINSTTGKDMNNVSDIKNVVLLLKTYKGIYPAQIVATLNWVPTETTYSLDQLCKELAYVRNNDTGELKGKFVMSNAVYAKDGSPATAVYATPLTINDIYTDEASAKAHPITIYVERAAAKVTVTTDNKDKFNLNKPVTIGSSNIDVYAEVLGWELYNDYQQSYLIKNIDLTWTNDALGFTWNDSPWYRCYWANSYNGEFFNNNFQYEYDPVIDGHKTKYGYGFGDKTDVTSGTFAENTYTYCGENTGRESSDRTKIILKAQLQDKSGNPVELARWYTIEYLGENDLRTAVANTLKYTLYYKDGDNYVGLGPYDLQCVSPIYDNNGTITNGAPANIEPYEVFFQLSDTGKAKTWYKNNSGSKHPMSTDVSTDPNGVSATNTYLAENVEPAVLYKSGQTYYYFDVQHLGNLTDSEEQTGEYGIVRNHIYAININSIGGYGSPIYIGTSNIVTPPEYPEDPEGAETSYVSAEVRILSWRIVSQGVDIQPTPQP